MSLGPAPANLGALEDAYLSYRASYARAGELIVQLTDSVSSAIALARPQSQRDAASSELSRNAAHIQHRLRRWSAEAKSILSSELARVSAFVEERNKAYHLEMLPLLDDLEQGRSSFQKVLATLEAVRADQDRVNSDFFDPYISTLRNLEESVDIESLVTFSLDEAERAKSDLDRLNALAQLGITVEIVGHEIEGLDSSISRSLGELPVDVKETPTYRTLQSSHLALSHPPPDLEDLWLTVLLKIAPSKAPSPGGYGSTWYVSVSTGAEEPVDLPATAIAKAQIPGIKILPASAAPTVAAGNSPTQGDYHIGIGIPVKRPDGNYDVTYSYYCGVVCAASITSVVSHDHWGWHIVSSRTNWVS